MEASNNGVGVVDGNWSHVCHGLDLGSTVVARGLVSKGRARTSGLAPREGDDLPLLDLVVRHAEAELAHAGLDGIPARQPRGEVDVSGETKVCRVDDLVCRGVVEDGLGVDASLVRERAEAGDGVVEGDVDLNSLGHQILNLLDHAELVLALDVFRARDHHAGHQGAEGADAVSLADAEHTGVDVRGTCLEGTEAEGCQSAQWSMSRGLDPRGPLSRTRWQRRIPCRRGSGFQCHKLFVWD